MDFNSVSYTYMLLEKYLSQFKILVILVSYIIFDILLMVKKLIMWFRLSLENWPHSYLSPTYIYICIYINKIYIVRKKVSSNNNEGI